MVVLATTGYLGLVLGFCFLVLAIASGLYYLSELVEEHTVIAKTFLTRMIYVVIALLLLMWLVDGFPAWRCLLSVASHVVYLQNLRRFPIVKLTDPVFLASCTLVLLNHYIWFRHFSAPPPHSPSSSKAPYRRVSPYENPYDPYPSFTEIASFFGLCVWLVPFSLFVSLSASENVLPSMGSEYATGEGSNYARAGNTPGKGSRQGMLKVAVDGVREWAPKTTTNPAKLAACLKYFHSSGVAHSIKELEKALSSVASVNSMQVKDYLQALTDENQVKVEKIGSGNWYWSFPGEEKRINSVQLQKATEDRDMALAAVADVKDKLSQAQFAATSQNDHAKVGNAISTKAELDKEVTVMRAELDLHKDNDPIEVEKKRSKLVEQKERVAVVTDQILEMERYLRDEMGMDREALLHLKMELYENEYAEDEEGLREYEW
ncbi:MAG: erv26 super protein [Chrysothrix sp. TS-e1954]|nr:MAG: erv26 super protein [Chrysothrix sp. TS-e1954]